VRTLVTFESSAFNTTESKQYFVNPRNYGDDVAKWMIAALQKAGVQTDDEPGQEDFGWYFEFRVPEGQHCAAVGFRPGDPAPQGCWIAWIERSRGLLGSLSGGRQRGIAASAAAAIHATLQSAEIRNIRWHEKKDFDAMREALGAETP